MRLDPDLRGEGDAQLAVEVGAPGAGIREEARDPLQGGGVRVAEGARLPHGDQDRGRVGGAQKGGGGGGAAAVVGELQEIAGERGAMACHQSLLDAAIDVAGEEETAFAEVDHQDQ